MLAEIVDARWSWLGSVLAGDMAAGVGLELVVLAGLGWPKCLLELGMQVGLHWLTRLLEVGARLLELGVLAGLGWP